MKTLNKSLLYSVLLSLSLGVAVTVVASVFINSRIEDAIRIKNVESIHQSVAPILNSALTISDFSEMQRTLGLLSSEHRRYGVYLSTGEWVLSDYGSQNLFESKVSKLQIKGSCREHFNIDSDSYCTEIQDNAILVSIESKKIAIFDLIRSNLWIIFFALTPMILVGLLGTKVLQTSILTPFFKVHKEIVDIKVDADSICKIEKLKTDREFEELSNIASAVNDLLAKIETANLEVQRREKALVLSEITSQVAHDIRSPLTALNLASCSLSGVAEEKRIMIRNSVARINDIANQLLEKGKALNQKASLSRKSINGSSSNSSLQVCLMSPLVEIIVSEKRVLFRDKIMIEIEGDFTESYGLFAKVDPAELKRVISNLINNSVESFTNERGRIIIKLRDHDNKLILTIQDNGKGMPEEIRKKLGEIGISYGKENSQAGSGLGVYHAKKSILNFGGTFDVESRVGVGTRIIIILPKEKAPEWFVDQIEISENTQIISIDDDLSVHGVWQNRISSLSKALNIKHMAFTSAVEFKDWLMRQGQDSNRVYLVDYEFLSQHQTGLDLIEELGIANNSILVTSRYEEDKVRLRCEKLKLKLIPKTMAGFVPLKLVKQKTKYDGILIDDDSIVHSVWKMSATANKKSLLCFSNPNDFFAVSDTLDKTSVLYIDSSLADGVKGEAIAKVAYENGYESIYLCTGYDRDMFPKMPWIRDIVGKSPQV